MSSNWIERYPVNWIEYLFHQIHWKLLVVFLLLEAYILYKTKYNSITLWDNQFAMEKLFYFCFGLVFVGKQSLWAFHRRDNQKKLIMVYQIILSRTENIILFILLRISLMFTRPPKSPQQTNSETEFLLNLMKSITLANVSKFFQIPMLIWNKHTSDVGVLLNHALVMGYVVLALTQVYSGNNKMVCNWFYANSNGFDLLVSVISCRGRCLSAFIVLIALCTKVMVSMKLESYLFWFWLTK